MKRENSWKVHLERKSFIMSRNQFNWVKVGIMLQFKAKVISGECPIYHIEDKMNASDSKALVDQIRPVSKHESPPQSH